MLGHSDTRQSHKLNDRAEPDSQKPCDDGLEDVDGFCKEVSAACGAEGEKPCMPGGCNKGLWAVKGICTKD